MTRTFAEEAGLVSPSEARRLERLAGEAELLVAETFGGVRRDPFDPEGDVLLPSGEIVDVKCVPAGFRWVNAGRKRPRSRVVVVERRPEGPAIAGAIPRELFRHGAPPSAGTLPCWWAPSTAVRPIRPRLTLGVDPPPPPRAADELRREENRLAQRRHRAREAAARGLGWAYPDDPPRGLGDGGGGRPAATREVDDGTDPHHR